MNYFLIFILLLRYCGFIAAESDNVQGQAQELVEIDSEVVENPKRVVLDLSGTKKSSEDVLVLNTLIFGVPSRVYVGLNSVFVKVVDGKSELWEAPENTHSTGVLMSLSNDVPKLLQVLAFVDTSVSFGFFERNDEQRWDRIPEAEYFLKLASLVVSSVGNPLQIDISADSNTENVIVPIGHGDLALYYLSGNNLVSKVNDDLNSIWSSSRLEKVIGVYVFRSNNEPSIMSLHIVSKSYGYNKLCYEKTYDTWNSVTCDEAQKKIDSLVGGFFNPAITIVCLAITAISVYSMV